MINDICSYLKNYFLRDYTNPGQHVHWGTYAIIGGSIEALPFLQPGQYFRIIGSTFNDGVWKYGTDTLTDETFDGVIWEMCVPKAFADLCGEIKAWTEANAQAVSGPYQSESFGGYSYSLKAGGAANGDGAFDWRTQFAARLAPYKRVSVL